MLDLIESLDIELLVETQANNSEQSGGQQGEQSGTQNWHSQWPNLQTGDTQEIPIAMRWTLTLPKMGDFERLWLLAYDDQ